MNSSGTGQVGEEEREGCVAKYQRYGGQGRSGDIAGINGCGSFSGWR